MSTNKYKRHSRVFCYISICSKHPHPLYTFPIFRIRAETINMLMIVMTAMMMIVVMMMTTMMVVTMMGA